MPKHKLTHSSAILSKDALPDVGIDAAVLEKLEKMGEALRQKQKLPMFEPLDSWTVGIPENPGVYAIWDINERNLAYIGETSSLKSRMRDIGKTKKHTFRRKVAKKPEMASNDEAGLSEKISKRYAVSFIEIQFGRAELEEFLILRWKPELNKKSAKRSPLSKHYESGCSASVGRNLYCAE
jgi:GIY-YIG catalytic domain